MEERYHSLIEDVSELVASRLSEDLDWLDEHHRFTLDGLVFMLVMLIGLRIVEKLFDARCLQRLDELRSAGFIIAKDPEVSLHTRFGTAQIRSPYLRNRETGETARPMKDQYGVRGKAKTLPLQRCLADFGSKESYQEAAETFERQYGFSIGRTSILRTTRRVGDEAEEFVEEKLATEAAKFDEGPTVSELFVSLDGCNIRTGRLMTAGQAGLAGKEGYEPDDVVRVEEWKEVRTGLVLRPGDADPMYVSRRGPYDEICEQMFGLAASLGLGVDTEAVACCDGGNGLREGLELVFANLNFWLDYSHVKNHFYETAEALEIEDELQKTWVNDFMDDLWADDEEVDDWDEQVEGVLERLRAVQQRAEHDRLQNLIEYLEGFSDAIAFGKAVANDWPTGSGRVESAHRYLPQARLKLPGACWRVENINPMMALRVIKKNGWWEEFSEWRVEQRTAA